MAEEHVVIPKERYQRMMDQLAGKKTQIINEEPKTRNNNFNSDDDDADVNEDDDKWSVPSTESIYDINDDNSKDSTPRTREDVTSHDTKNTEGKNVLSDKNITKLTPPGITPAELEQLAERAKKVKKRPKKVLTQKKGIKKTVLKKLPNKNSTSNKRSLALIKKHWQIMK